MKKELEKKIFGEFPELFKHRYDIKLSLMSHGFMHDDGWLGLVHDLCRDIKAELEKEPLENFYIQEVKEKFGGLRFYVSCGTERLFKLINEAEKKSYSICEKCGKPGKLRIGKLRVRSEWYKTLCETCAGDKWEKAELHFSNEQR